MQKKVNAPSAGGASLWEGMRRLNVEDLEALKPHNGEKRNCGVGNGNSALTFGEGQQCRT